MRLSELPENWRNYQVLNKHFSIILDKQIKWSFLAPHDPILAKLVYNARNGGVGFPLYEHEKKDLYIWVAFVDGSIELLSEALRDDYLVNVLNENGLIQVSLTAEDEWTEFQPWPRGFGIDLSYSSKPLYYQIQDEDTGNTINQTIPETWRDSIFLNYWNGHQGLSQMKKPRIRFKAAQFETSDISLVFDARPY